MNIGKFLTGITVAAIGVLLLLANFGVIDRIVLLELWRLWPLILVAAGISILSKGLPRLAAAILNILVGLAAIAAIWWFVALAISGDMSCRSFSCLTSASEEIKSIAEVVNEDTDKIRLELSLGAGKLGISGSETTSAVSGEVKSAFFSPSVTRSAQEKTDVIKIHSDQKPWLWPVFWGKNDWRLALNRDIPSELILATGAIDAKIDLSEARVEKIQIKSGASSYDITFGEKPQKTSAEIDLGASSLRIGAPNSSGLKIKLDGQASSNNFTKAGLAERDGTFYSDNFDEAAKKIEIDLATGASSVELIRF